MLDTRPIHYETNKQNKHCSAPAAKKQKQSSNHQIIIIIIIIIIIHHTSSIIYHISLYFIHHPSSITPRPPPPPHGTSRGRKWIAFMPEGRFGTSNQATGPVTLAADAPSMMLILPRACLGALVMALMSVPVAARWPARGQ